MPLLRKYFGKTLSLLPLICKNCSISGFLCLFLKTAKKNIFCLSVFNESRRKKKTKTCLDGSNLGFPSMAHELELDVTIGVTNSLEETDNLILPIYQFHAVLLGTPVKLKWNRF